MKTVIQKWNEIFEWNNWNEKVFYNTVSQLDTQSLHYNWLNQFLPEKMVCPERLEQSWYIYGTFHSQRVKTWCVKLLRKTWVRHITSDDALATFFSLAAIIHHKKQD